MRNNPQLAWYCRKAAGSPPDGTARLSSHEQPMDPHQTDPTSTLSPERCAQGLARGPLKRRGDPGGRGRIGWGRTGT